MNEIELYYDGSTPLRYWDQAGLVPTSASVSLVAPDGTVVASPTVTLPSLSTTTTAATATTLTLAAVTGLRQGSHLAVTNNGVVYACEVSQVDGLMVHLAAGLPLVVDTGAVVKAMDMTATIAAPGAGLIGPNYRVIWVYSDGTVTDRVSQLAAIVRWPWTPVVSGADVRTHLVEVHTNAKFSETKCDSVAERANSQIRSALAAVQRRPWLYLSSQMFRDAGLAAMRYELALMGTVIGGQVIEAQRECRYAMDDQLKRVLTSLAAYDQDDSGTIDAAEAKPLGFTIRVVL